MPTIAIVGEYGSLNGGERSLLAVLPQLVQRDFSFRALVPSPSDFAEALHDAGSSVQPFFFHADGKRKGLSQVRRELLAALRQNPVDLVHANSLSTARVLGPLTSQLKCPTIGHLRDILRLSAQAMTDLGQLDCLLAVSAATCDFHAENGLSLEKTQVLYNGVDLEAFRPRASTGELRQQLGLPPTAQLVIAVGQIGLRKGLEVLIEAAKPLCERCSDVHFAIVGERNSSKGESIAYETELRQICARPPLAGRVHWLGRRSDVARVMNEADLLVHSAHQEPLGRVLLEAFACGLPSLAMRVGGNAEIFLGQELDRLLLPAGDVSALSRAMADLLESGEKRARVSKMVRSIAKKHFAADTCAERLAEIYHCQIASCRN